MQIDLTGKTAVVTGSTAGIGLAIAQGLAGSGARVVLNGRTPEAVERAIEAVREHQPSAQVDGVAADLSTAEGCGALVAAQPVTDILVNNLGIYNSQDFFETPDEEWQRFFDINVMSGVRLARAYVPKMLKKHWGRVVFMSSESALNIPPDMIHYGFSKTANLSVSRGLAKRLAGTGITVNAVMPGPTLSEGVGKRIGAFAEQQGMSVSAAGAAFVRARRPSSIIQRVASVEEVANMVVYVCSPQASATTGAALRVDGGIVDTLA